MDPQTPSTPDLDGERHGARGIGVIIIAGAALLLLEIVNAGYPVSMWTALLLKPLMHGVSLVKTDFLLLFTLTVATIVMLGSRVRSARSLAALGIAFALAVTLGALLGMYSFLDVAHRLGLPLDRYAYFFSGQYNTVNHFAHLHTTKVGLYYILRALGLQSIAAHADSGLPLAGYVNPLTSMAVVACAGVALIALLAAAGCVVGHWTGARRPVALILYSLAGSHTVKCLLDGGLLAYDFLPSLVVLYVMFRCATGDELIPLLRRRGLLLVLVAVLFLGATALFSADFAIVVQSQQYGAQYALYITLGALLVLTRQHILRFAAVVLPCVAWLGFFYLDHTLADISALNARITSQDRIVKFTYGVESPQGDSPGSAYVVPSLVGKPTYAAYVVNEDNPLRNRNTVVKSADEDGYTGFLFALRVLKADSDAVRLTSNDYITLRGMDEAGPVSDSLFVLRVAFNRRFFSTMWDDSPSIVVENNRFAVLYYLNRYLAAAGVHEYVLMPLCYEAVE